VIIVIMVQYIVKSTGIHWNPLESTGVHVDYVGEGKVLCRMVFATDRLIPTLRWSQITSTQTILMINSVEIKTSRILLAESGR
jgi:hypothetical protein